MNVSDVIVSKEIQSCASHSIRLELCTPRVKIYCGILYKLMEETVHTILLSLSLFALTHIASFPGSSGGEGRAWYALFAHAQEFTEKGQ